MLAGLFRGAFVYRLGRKILNLERRVRLPYALIISIKQDFRAIAEERENVRFADTMFYLLFRVGAFQIELMIDEVFAS